MFSQLLLQITYILFPLFIYYSFIKTKSSLKKYHSSFVGFFCGLSMFLCMTYPISFVTGNMMDLRTIPWLIAFLYGSVPVGILLTGLMFIYRIFIGGAGMYVVFIAYSISLVVVLLYLKEYISFGYKEKVKRTFITTLVNAILIVTCIQIIFMFDIQEVISFYLFFILLHILIMWVTVYIIETFRENEQLQLEIQKAERLKVVGQMAASVAHEIRNPMTVVSGFMQILNQSIDIPRNHKDQIKVMMTELNRAQIIINDYLTLAKPQAEALTAIDVKEQLDKIVQTTTPYALMKSVKINFEYRHEGKFIVYGNVEKFQQVIINILKNGIEASPECAEIYVSIAKENKFIHIYVRDIGDGLSEEQIEQLGTPFYSTKTKGTGLGLTVSYSIVNSMEGQIDVQSDVGEGTCFKIKLPEYKEVL